MDDFKPELLKALLEWVNTFDLPRKITQWSQLEDGQILWQILADVDPEYFHGDLPETDRKSTENWIPRWQNLKHIDRAVTTYIRDECGKLPVLSKKMNPDLKLVAQNGSPKLTAKLAMSVLLVAFYSSNSNQRMIQVVSSLGQQTAGTIATAIQEMEGWDQRMAELGVDQELTSEPDTSDPGPPPRLSSVERDPDLEREAELIQANREIKQLTSKIAILTSNLETSRARISTLEEELVESNLMLDRGVRQQSDNDDLERFRSEALRDRQHIAELEGELADEKALVTNQERQLERLKADAESKQDLRDELQLVKSERDELSQKAKANENLHKKIRALNEAAKAGDITRQDLQQAREELDELRPFKERCNALEKVNKENLKTIENGEQSLFEEKSRRTRVEHENQVLLKQLDQARDLQTRAEDFRKELEDKVRELESSNHTGRGGSLEDELNVDDSTEIADETPKAMTESIATSETIMLHQKVDILSNRLKSIEKQYLEMLQENLGLKSDLKHGITSEESERPFLEQNEKLKATETELQDLQRQFQEKELENAELRNELSKGSTSTDTEGPEFQALRANNERLLKSFEDLQKHSRSIEGSLDEKTGLLRTALLEYDNLPEELRQLRSAELLKQIRAQIESVLQAPPEEKPKSLEATAMDITDRLQSGQAALDAAKKDLQTQKSALDAVKLELEQAKREGGGQASESLQQEIDNLRRENKLITTAWYDMTTRLQSNTVVLQRRSEAPKSWLGRQRAVVGGLGSTARR